MINYQNVGGQAPVMSPQEVAQKQRLAKMLMDSGSNTANMRHWTEALGSVLQSGVGMWKDRQAADGEARGRAQGNEALAAMLDGKGAAPALANPYSSGDAMKMQISDRNAARSQSHQEQMLRLRQQLQADDPARQLDLEYKRAQIEALKNKGTVGGVDAPSSVREWEYFSKLPPEQQQQFLVMKRAQQNLDLGTSYGVPNPMQPGQLQGEVKKNLVDAEAQKELGIAVGKQAAAAPSDLSSADTALELVDSIRTDPNRSAGTGTLSPIGNMIPKTPGYAFQKKVNQARSGAFLTAIQQLRGMGALSNAEGQTATDAVTRMDTATDDAAFEEALVDYERVVMRGRRAAERIMKERQRLLGGQQPTAPSQQDEGWEEIDGVRIRVKR